RNTDPRLRADPVHGEQTAVESDGPRAIDRQLQPTAVVISDVPVSDVRVETAGLDPKVFVRAPSNVQALELGERRVGLVLEAELARGLELGCEVGGEQHVEDADRERRVRLQRPLGARRQTEAEIAEDVERVP